MRCEDSLARGRDEPCLRAGLATSLCAAAAVAVVYLLRAVDARYLLWPSVGLDFSTHTAFATALLTSLAMFEHRWAWPALLALTLYSGLVVALRYHSVLDVVTSALVIAATTAALHWAGHRQPRPWAGEMRSTFRFSQTRME